VIDPLFSFDLVVCVGGQRGMMVVINGTLVHDKSWWCSPKKISIALVLRRSEENFPESGQTVTGGHLAMCFCAVGTRSSR
jgi:hypothetical protein